MKTKQEQPEFDNICKRCDSTGIVFEFPKVKGSDTIDCPDCNGTGIEPIKPQGKPKEGSTPNQNLFDALQRTCNFTALQDEMNEIMDAVDKDREALPKISPEFDTKEYYSFLSNYWNKRCLLAEDCLNASPSDPDITPEQIEAHRAYNEFMKIEEFDLSQFQASNGWVSVDFETVQSDLNKNFDNIRIGAEHAEYLNNKYEVRLLPSLLSPPLAD